MKGNGQPMESLKNCSTCYYSDNDLGYDGYTCRICLDLSHYTKRIERIICKEESMTELKPGLKYDKGKLRFDLVLPIWEEGIARALTYGANKYTDNSWQNVDDFKNRYYAALRRHLNAYRKGEIFDEESGLMHLEHALANIGFLLWKQLQELDIKGNIVVGPKAGASRDFGMGYPAMENITYTKNNTKYGLDPIEEKK